MNPIQQDVQEAKVGRVLSGEGQQPSQFTNLQKHRMFNISKSITIKHPQLGPKVKTEQDGKEQQNKTQNQSSDLLQKLIQKLSQKQNQRDQNLKQLNENMNKLVNLFVEKWTQPEMDHQRSIKQKKNKKEVPSNQKLNIQQEQKVNRNNTIQKLNMSENQEFKVTSLNTSEYPPQFQSRLKVISVKLPPKNSSRNEILVWVGNMCKKVLSVGFKLYKNDQLDFKKVKVFCSENILRNMILLPKEIKQQHWSAIDNCLKNELFPYFRFNYPQTEENGISNLSNIFVEKDILNENSHKNDIVLLSGVKFDLQQDENYNPQIMQLLNYVISVPNMSCRLQKIDIDDRFFLIKQFKNNMQKIFQFIELQQNVEEIKNFNPVRPQDKIQRQSVKQYIKNNFKINEEYYWSSKQQEQSQKVEGYSTMNKQRHNQSLKYKQKVKSYTSQQIGQKLPQNIELFSKYQIQNGNLKLKNPSLMRLVTEWCSQLQQFFDPKEILERENPWKMKNGSEDYLQKNQKITLNMLLQRQKKIINKKLKQIKKNNYQNQIQFSNREIHEQLKKFSEEEATVGQFCSSVFKINEAYLIKYLNLLIHGINRALRYFQNIQRANLQLQIIDQCKVFEEFEKNQETILNYLSMYFGYKNEDREKNSAISITPQLIKFQIEDLFNCKLTSKEYEITALYKFVQYLSHTKPQFIKILRTKENINQDNKEIIIHMLYRESIVVQMQLVIKSDRPKFIECCNKFNHYFYELQRAHFGPIMEMCNIWSSQDQRSKFYLSKIQENNKRDKSKKAKQCCLKSSNQQMSLPFKCQVCCCTYYECHYNQNQKHSKCSKCNIYICFLCQFNEADEKNKKKMFPPLKQYLELVPQSLKTCDKLPKNGGFLFNINSKNKKMKFFKPIIQKKECYLLSPVIFQNLYIKNLQVLAKYIFKEKRQEDEQQQKKRFAEQLQVWFEALSKSNLLFQYQSEKQYFELDEKKIQMFYFIPKFFISLGKSQKKSVTLVGKGLGSSLIELKVLFFHKNCRPDTLPSLLIFKLSICEKTH